MRCPIQSQIQSLDNKKHHHKTQSQLVSPPRKQSSQEKLSRHGSDHQKSEENLLPDTIRIYKPLPIAAQKNLKFTH